MRPSAGSASATSTAVLATTEMTGCRSTGPSTRCQIVRSPLARRTQAPRARSGHVRTDHTAAMPRPTSPNPRPTMAAPGMRARKPADFGASSAGSTVSEPMTAQSTTRIVPTARPANRLLPLRNMPLIATITVRPETSTARPDVAAAISIASMVVLPSGPFAALAGEVEDRVVDTDREADQEDHGLRHVGDGQQVAGEGREAAGGADRAHREQHRDAGRHEAAEREHQDQQRQRQRQGLGLLEILALRLVVDLGERRLTGLTDGEAGMGRGGGRGRGQRRCDLVAGRVLRAGDLEADQRGVTVGRDGALVVRGAQLLHVLGRREASHDVVDDGAELRVAGLQRRRGDDHLLLRLRAEARAVEGARRDAALPRAGLRRLQLLRAGHAADHDRQHDERDPAGNCLPRVPGTPGADGSRQSSLGIHYLRAPSPRRTCIA